MRADPGSHATAARIEREFPLRVVMYGACTRQYWAYPQFDVPAGTIVHSGSPDELARQMLAAELAARRPGSLPFPGAGGGRTQAARQPPHRRQP